MHRIDHYENSEDYEFASGFYSKYEERQGPITLEDISRFFSLAPTVCRMTDLSVGENALQTVREKHPGAICY
jgi:hypothetical protein